MIAVVRLTFKTPALPCDSHSGSSWVQGVDRLFTAPGVCQVVGGPNLDAADNGRFALYCTDSIGTDTGQFDRRGKVLTAYGFPGGIVRQSVHAGASGRGKAGFDRSQLQSGTQRLLTEPKIRATGEE